MRMYIILFNFFYRQQNLPRLSPKNVELNPFNTPFQDNASSTSVRNSHPEKQSLKACNFITKETATGVFPVNFAKFLRTTFFQTTPPVAASVVCKFSTNDLESGTYQEDSTQEASARLLSTEHDFFFGTSVIKGHIFSLYQSK